MAIETRVPPLGSSELRVWDARVAGGLLAVIGVISGATDLSSGGPGPVLGLLPPVFLGALLVARARRVPAWLLTLLAAVAAAASSATAVQHVAPGAGAGGADGSATLVLIALQMCVFRSRREAWLQVGWAVSVFGAALVWKFGLASSASSWVLVTAVIAVLTGAGTWTRRSFDQLLSQLHHQADHDPLTGLLNRDGLHRHLARELRARRYQVGQVDVTVLILDIDHFKMINDTWGHPAGDEVLVWLSGLLRAAIHPPESAARFGGEEFLVVLPGGDLVGAYDRAERLRQLVASGAASLRHPVTVSIGIATGDVPADGGDLTDLYARADEALYRAKQAGRNRVEVASDGIPDLPAGFSPDLPAGISPDLPAETAAATLPSDVPPDPTPGRRTRPR